MEYKIKNRDASDKYKGFRYQKIRLAKRMLELINEDENTNIIAIPEYKDDSFFVDKNGIHILEQNKEYSKCFTLNSNEIKKSIINFLDYYLQAEESNCIHFIFYTNVNYTTEAESDITKKLGLTLIDDPILSFLEKKNYTDEIIEFVSKFITEAYKRDYKIDDEESKTCNINYIRIKDMTKEEWKIFLNTIDFEFGQVNLEKMEEEIEKDIRKCKFFGIEHLNKIQNIKSRLLDDIDRKMSQKDWLQRIINKDTIKLIYLECGNSKDALKEDNTYKMWAMIKEKYLDDSYRNLEEKIRAVAPDVSKKTIRRHNLSVTSGNISIDGIEKNNADSLRVRVYQAMAEFFSLEMDEKDTYTDEEISRLISTIQRYVINNVSGLKEDYNYGLKNNTIIGELVLMLIDECFYAFDDN